MAFHIDLDTYEAWLAIDGLFFSCTCLTCYFQAIPKKFCKYIWPMQCYTEPERKGAEKGNYCNNLEAGSINRFFVESLFFR